ncbi:hypothetical protein SO078_29280 (plasmid) [Sinorhizobium meliloti]|uniref:hypothetical protein n=1 Tax=Rhizobium meliloti TaxID=382 RepID=UPI002D777639|nr:hypothetical protein [Sinorhizobium meliloti]WRQ71323.1 hypothetical protein SO078_29280 [Sinorhizobium meliloti]
MAINRDDFIERFQKEIGILKNLQERVGEAIGRAEGRLRQVVEEGKSVEDVFGPIPPKK